MCENVIKYTVLNNGVITTKVKSKDYNKNRYQKPPDAECEL